MTVSPFIARTEDVLAVARRLLPLGISVYAHECSCVHFGSWSVVAGIEHERFQFRWDGRTSTFVISRGVLADGKRVWDPVRTLNLLHPEAISGTEAFLRERFTT